MCFFFGQDAWEQRVSSPQVELTSSEGPPMEKREKGEMKNPPIKHTFPECNIINIMGAEILFDTKLQPTINK